MRERTYYFDNVKILLVIEVVLIHVFLSYSHGIWWFYKSSASNDLMLHYTQIFTGPFMSVYFFVFSYFLTPDYNSKGARRFLQKRVWKYLITIVLGTCLVVIPLSYWYHCQVRNIGYFAFGDYFKNIFLGVNGQPADWYDPYWAVFPELKVSYFWFLQHCMIYTVLFVPLSFLIKKCGSVFAHYKKFLLPLLLVLSYLLVYILRCNFAIDYWGGFLGFIQVEYANVGKYIVMISLAVIAYHENWIDRIPKTAGISMFAVSTVIYVLAVLFAGKVSWIGASGKPGVDTAIWTFIDLFNNIIFVFGLLAVFKYYLNSAKYKSLSLLTFYVYIVHVPILVLFQYFTDLFHWPGFGLKVVVQFIGGVLLSFFAAWFYVRMKNKFYKKK